jgi:hypothetical protein
MVGISLTAFSDLLFRSFLLQADFSLKLPLKNPGGGSSNLKKIYKKNTDTVCFLCYSEYIP